MSACWFGLDTCYWLLDMVTLIVLHTLVGGSITSTNAAFVQNMLHAFLNDDEQSSSNVLLSCINLE